MERRTLGEERRAPRYARGKEGRRGYARHRFLRGFRVSLRGVAYGLEWVTVRSPVLYRGEGEDWRSRSGRRGPCSGPSSCPCWERRALNPGAGGEGGLQDRGREVGEVEGRKGVLPIALGLTEDGVRAVLWS